MTSSPFRQPLTSALNIDGQERFDLEFLRRLLQAIDVRLKPLQEQQASVDKTLVDLQSLTLERVNNVLTPAIDQVLTLAERGFLVAQSSTDATIEIGNILVFTIEEGVDRDLFTPSPFVALTRKGSTDDYAIARAISYDKVSGAFRCEVLSAVGSSGPHSDWVIGALAGSTAAQYALFAEAETFRDEVIAARDATQAYASNAADSEAASEESANRVDLGALDDAVTATAADRVATGEDRDATAADRVATGEDRDAIAADRVQTGEDRDATGADRVQTGLDVVEASSARDAAFVNADVYADIAAGRAAVADGEQFQVVSGREIIRYRRDSASTQSEVARHYSQKGVDDPARDIWGLYFFEPYYEKDGLGNLYLKPKPYDVNGFVSYIRGGWLPDAEFTYDQIKADLNGMAAPGTSALGITSPLGVADCIRLSPTSEIFYDTASGTWGWGGRGKRHGDIIVVRNDGFQHIGQCTEYAEIVRNLNRNEFLRTRPEHLAPIITAHGYPPAFDTVAKTLTFTVDTLIMVRNVPYRVDETVVIDLNANGSSTKVIYMDLRDKSFVLRKWNSPFSTNEQHHFVLIAVVRMSGYTLHASMSCPYLVDGGSPYAGLENKQADWAGILTPLGHTNTAENFPNYNTGNKTLTLYPDSILISGDERLLLTAGATIGVDTGSSASRVFWDTGDNSLFSRAWTANITAEEARRCVLIAVVRDGTASGFTPVLSMMCPYTVDGHLLGEIDLNPPAPPLTRPAANALDVPASVRGIAHRGFSATHPENTLPAYTEAYRQGFEYCECDISFTSDGVPVLLHDSTIDRTSTGTGAIADMTLAEARAFDYGSWKGAEFAGTQMPTLLEFLRHCVKLRLHPYIEIKSGLSQAQADQIVDEVAVSGMAGKVSYISFGLANLEKMAAADPRARLGLVGSITSGAIASAATLKNSGNEVFFDSHHSVVTRPLVEECLRAGMQVEVWTVNDGPTALSCVDLGVTGISTDLIDVQAVIDADLGI